MKLKEWWEKYWFPVGMNLIFAFWIFLGYISTTKVSLFIAVVSLIIYWNLMFFVTLPQREDIAYLNGFTTCVEKTVKVLQKKQSKKKK